MSQDELERLKAEEAELMKKLSALRRDKDRVIAERRRAEEEERKRRDLETPVILSVTGVFDYGVSVSESRFRSDTHNTVTRYGSGHYIRLSNWDEFSKAWLACSNAQIIFEGDTEERLNWYQNAPNWHFDFDEVWNSIHATPGPKANRYKIRDIPGSTWMPKQNYFRIPANESWRIPSIVEGIEDVEYTEPARRVIFEQLENRTRLDRIAKQEDSDVLREGLNGNALRPFQRVGVEFGIATGGRFILADDTGLGKTWQGTGIAELLRQAGGDRKDDFQTLCIVKAANIANWRREIKRLTGIDPVMITSGKNPNGAELKAVILDRHPYVLVSYDTLGSKVYTERDRLKEKFPGPLNKETREAHEDWNKGYYPWSQLFEQALPDLVILDEAHQVKNRETNRFEAIQPLRLADHVIPMTASPVMNRTPELWTLLHLVNPGEFDSYPNFVNRYTYDGRNPKNSQQLHELMRPVFLRRAKADVLKDLPPINRINQYHTLSPEAMNAYQLALAGIYKELKTFDPRGEGGTEMNIANFLSQITRLKQICAADKIDFTSDLATNLSDEKDAKVLIFSHFKGTAYNIGRKLGHQAVCTVENRGADKFESLTARDRDKLFEAAREDSNVRFIVTTSAANEGHNIEYCDFVIFNDLFWGPKTHHQCEGRAYGRLSNPHPIDAHYVIADVQIERWIMELLEEKLKIIDEVVDGAERSRDVTGNVASELLNRIRQQLWKGQEELEL